MNKTMLQYYTPVLGAIAVLMIIYIIYKRLIADPATDTYQDEIKENNLTYSDSQYFIFADSIQAATQGIGTDEEAIYNVFRQLYSNDDFLKLFTAFGRRTYGGINGLFYNAALGEVLSIELTASEIEIINNILTDNAITLNI